MHDPRRMRRLYRGEDGQEQREGVRERERRLGGERPAQIVAAQELHH
jgi:hypothetical protein